MNLSPAERKKRKAADEAHVKAHKDDPLYVAIREIVDHRGPKMRAKFGTPAYPGLLDLTLDEIEILGDMTRGKSWSNAVDAFIAKRLRGGA